MGGAITVFKNSQSNKLTDLLINKLKMNQASNSQNGQFKYTIDVSNNIPTIDQFKFFQNSLHTNPNCKKSFKHSYPDLTHDLNLVKDLQSIDPAKNSELINNFKTPLVVDWDNQLLAYDEKSLNTILDQYNGREDI